MWPWMTGMSLVGAQKPIQNPGQHPWGKFQCFSAGSFWDVWNKSHRKKLIAKYLPKKTPSFEHFHVNFQGVYIYIMVMMTGEEEQPTKTPPSFRISLACRGKRQICMTRMERISWSARGCSWGNRKFSQLARQNFPKDQHRYVMGWY